jgi:hypothetical protein
LTAHFPCPPQTDSKSCSIDHYVRAWFIPFETLVRRTGGTEDQVRALIEAGAAPGPIYAFQEAEGWWSALSAFKGEQAAVPSTGSTAWYTPAAIYWLRRAFLVLRSGASPAAAAASNREAFIGQFVEALKVEPLSAANYPQCFPDGTLDLAAAREAGASEWANWQNGSFAVCLRSFTGTAVVTKESFARRLRTELAGERTMPDAELLDMAERLASVMMPFAPFERPICTPGVTIDRLVETLGLGDEEPYDGFR